MRLTPAEYRSGSLARRARTLADVWLPEAGRHGTGTGRGAMPAIRPSRARCGPSILSPERKKQRSRHGSTGWPLSGRPKYLRWSVERMEPAMTNRPRHVLEAVVVAARAEAVVTIE